MEPPDRVADWALFKSLVLPLSTLALLGIDQVVVREPSKLMFYVRPALLTVTGIAGAISLIAWAIGAYDNVFYIFLGTLLLSLSGLYFGIFRANMLFNMAHIARDGWKLLLFLAIVAAHLFADIGAPLLMIIACGVTVLFCVSIWQRTNVTGIVEQHDEISGFKSALAVSLPFCAAAFSLSIASYGEILLLKIFDAESKIDTYFRAIILFSYPAMIMNTYIVTFLSSIIRQNPEKISRKFLKYSMFIVPIVIVIPIISLVVGFFLEIFLFPDQETPLYLAVLLSSIAGVRFAYTFLTSFVGALGDQSEIKVISLLYLWFAVMTPAICLPIYLLSDDIIFAVAATAMIHWLARGLVGWRLTIRLARRASLLPGR